VTERQAAERNAAESQQRYQAAREVVATLQEALLPTALPVLAGARVAARYLVAAQDQAAGGDWFDAIPLPGGRIALVVGDVVGHGVAASAAMGQLRAVLKHVLATEPGLAAALAQADMFASAEPALLAATLCVAVLDPADGALVYATCGHPEPLVVAANGTPRFLPGTGGGPLGTGPAPELATGTMEPGDLLLLYSDGLIERPGRTLDEGKELLATVAADAAADRVLPVGAAATPADRVCQLTVELLTRTGYADDVTTLAAERLRAPVPGMAVELPAALASVAVIRDTLDEWLDQIGPAASDRLTVRLAVIEAVTNAIEHAYPPGQSGPVRVQATLGDDGYVQATVTDQGRWLEPDPAAVTVRGHGLMLAGQMSGYLRVTHPPQSAGAPPGARGTVVTLRHQLRRPAMLASQPSIAAADRPAPPFSADLAPAGPEPHVRVAGPLDVTTAPQLTGRLLSACRGGVLPLTVDLTAVTVLASAGVRVLHEVSAQLAAHQRQLTLVAETGSAAAAVLDMVRLPRRATRVEEAGLPSGPAESATSACGRSPQRADPWSSSTGPAHRVPPRVCAALPSCCRSSRRRRTSCPYSAAPAGWRRAGRTGPCGLWAPSGRPSSRSCASPRCRRPGGHALRPRTARPRCRAPWRRSPAPSSANGGWCRAALP
jgi:anti-anti-sigma factor